MPAVDNLAWVLRNDILGHLRYGRILRQALETCEERSTFEPLKPF